MRFLSKPLLWLLFGVFGYPLVCLAVQFAAVMAFAPLGWLPKEGISAFGFGDVPLYHGLTPAVVSALFAWGWENERFAAARAIAFVGGFLCAGLVLNEWLLNSTLGRWTGNVGFVVPPLFWAACLVIVGFFARAPAKQR